MEEERTSALVPATLPLQQQAATPGFPMRSPCTGVHATQRKRPLTPLTKSLSPWLR
jgi:hypothetical protein